MMRRSCLTGKVVWICRAASRNAANWAYWHACKAEIERFRHLPEKVQQRKAEILNFLSLCLQNIPITEDLTPEQKEAARQLKNLSQKNPYTNTDFFNHVIEERRLRAEDRAIRKQMRERES